MPNRGVEQRERELAILSHVAARVHGSDDEQEILDIALEEILTRMQLHAAWILAGDDRDKRLRLAAHRGLSNDYLEDVRCNGLSDCLCREVFATGLRLQARNTTQCPRMPHIVAGLDAPVAHACIPLKFDGRRRGVLNVAALPGQAFSDGELSFLDTLGHQIGLAVERARGRQAERTRDRQARAMASMSRAVGSALDASAVLGALCETAREALSADAAEVWLERGPGGLELQHSTRPTHAATLDGRGLRAVMAERRPARLRGPAHGIAVPLLVDESILGLLAVTTTEPRDLTEEQVETAESLASQAAVALQKARHYDEARRALAELKQAQSRIIQSERMAVLGTFASGLAHEVRNPLNSMGLQLSILERRTGRCEPALGEEMRALAAIIREEIHRLESLVEDFLLFSRAGRVQPRTIPLRPVVSEVVALLAPEADAAGIALVLEGDEAPAAAIDAEKMKQVVINLVRNAMEATVNGGAVRVRCHAEAGSATLTVADDGPGLPAGVALFEPFVTTKPKGTGLGLAIVQQIVMQHGGDITAANQEQGKGALFTVTLPLASLEEEKS